MIEAINRRLGLALGQDGACYEVTDWFDSDGDFCEPDEALACVVDMRGKWASVDLDQFEDRKSH